MADDILHRFKPETMVDKQMDNQRPIYTGAGFFSATGNEQQLTCKTGIGVEEAILFQKTQIEMIQRALHTEIMSTLQEINISHLGKRKIIFKYALSGGYVNSLQF